MDNNPDPKNQLDNHYTFLESVPMPHSQEGGGNSSQTGLKKLTEKIQEKKSLPEGKEVSRSIDATIQKIRDREPEAVTENFTRAMTALKAEYTVSRLTQKDHPKLPHALLKIIGGNPSAKYEKELQVKAQAFRHAFETDVFNQVEHSAPNSLPEELDLKSPQALQQGENDEEGKIGLHSGTLDHKMGNTRYVFANYNAMPSRSFNEYARNFVITSQDGYVVPIDHADMHATERIADTQYSGNFEEAKLAIYADNIYTLQDFKTLFSTYAATFFETSQEALGFFNRYTQSRDISRADFWTEDVQYLWGAARLSEEELDNDREKFTMMKTFLEKTNIYPPFCPELQFRDRVHARRKENPKPLPSHM
jgi:hypothetical protein